MKTCARCKTEKQLDCFNKSKANLDGLHSYCRQCSSEVSKLFYNSKKSKILKQKAEWHEQNRKDRLSEMKQRRLDNYEHYQKMSKQYQKNNKDKCNMWASAYRARKLKASGYGNEELNELVLQEAYTVAKERTETTGVKHHVDHIIPLQGLNACGFHCWNNVQVIPWMDNLQKSNKLIEGLL